MALSFVLFSIAVFYIAEKIREQLAGKIGEYVVEKMEEYVAFPIGDYINTPIGRQLGYLLSLAVLYIAEKSRETLEQKIGEYVVAPIREYMVAPIGRELGCLFFYNSNIEDFRTRRENLRNTRDVVQGRVDDAKKNGEVILPNVREWQTNVNKVIEESRNIFDDEHQLNLKLRYQRSRNAKEKTSDVDKLTREGNSFDSVSTYALAFKSRKFIFDKIMEAVKDGGIGMIGIYGMGGVGKTTLAKEVQQQANDGNLFDKVVMSVVSQPPDFRRIQGDIADKLCLKLDAEGIPGRAEKLSKRLKEIKKILIILDDVWKPVELEAIGIPFGERHKGCKIVLTSRSEQVCNDCNLMNSTTQKNFSIEVLSDEEGWKLFRKMAGDSVDSPDLRDLPSMVAKECAGLPLAIVTVARALQKKSVEVWRDALNKLRLTPDKEVFSRLELSYSYLEDVEAKSFFLLCCLFPEDSHIPIESLMMYGMGWRLFKNVSTVDKARDRAYALVDSLKSSCLLQEGWSEEFVKMHDVIRDVAISIASKSEQAFLVRAGAGWKEELQEEDAFKRYAVISLWSDDIDELPVELECPKLQILLLRSTWSSLQFPNNLSLRMENLKVLDIFSINFLSLPQSFENLRNLRTLCLNYCNLNDISIVGELKKLEIISIRNSDIEELPKKIGMLTQLKLLDLTGCQKLTVIPSDVIAGLSRLEGLYMDRSFVSWEIIREDKERSNASLAELKHLSHLINLEIRIPFADHFPDDLLFKSLSRFKISVGTWFPPWKERYSCSKTLKLQLYVSSALKNRVKELLRKVEHFHLLGKMKGLKSAVYDLDREGFRDLRYLIVEKCSEVEHIFNAAECSGLQELRLRKLPRLINLWKDPTRHVGFRNLTVVIVEECERLKNLFSHSVAKQLSKVLVELEVENCKIMEEIVGNGKEAASVEVDDIVFLRLRSLELRGLPNLRNFCSNVKGDLDTHTQEPLFDKKVSFPQLKALNVEGCHKVSKVVQFNLLQSLEEFNVGLCDSLEEVVEVEVEVEGLVVEETLNQLRELKLWLLPKLKHIMRCNKYPHRILGFRNLSSIDIFKCNSLKSLFSPFMANCLAQLKEVEIHFCEMMESIIAEEREGEENWEEIIVFPQLRTLKLKNLPKLISFMKTIQQKLRIKDEIVKEAPQEDNLPDPIQPLFNKKVAFTNLVELRIFNMGNLKEIFHTRLADESFSQLRILHVRECHKLSRVAPSNLLPRLKNLKGLIVEGCYSMEKIFELEGEGRTPISLSQLGNVVLFHLPNLMMFCSGKYDFELPSLEIFRLRKCPKMETFTDGLKSTPNLRRASAEWNRGVWKGDLNSTIHHLFQEEEIKQCLYVIKDLVHGLHSCEQESSVQEDEEKDKDEEVGEKSEEANIEEQERKENISVQAVHHKISEEAEQEGNRKGSMEAIREHLRAIREHLKVMTNLLDGLVFRETELGVEEEEEEEESEISEEEGESEKSGEANIEELQVIWIHLGRVMNTIMFEDGLRKQKRVVVIREHLKRMMDLVDRLGLREQELSIAKLESDISSGKEVEEGEEGENSSDISSETEVEEW